MLHISLTTFLIGTEGDIIIRAQQGLMHSMHSTQARVRVLRKPEPATRVTQTLSLRAIHCFLRCVPVLERKAWCERGDSNPHPLRDQILSLARLPIPPLSHIVISDYCTRV